FGDIFFNNCFSNGVLPVRLPADRVARIRVILHELPGAKMSIDLATQTVVGPDGRTDTFEIDSFRKECLLKGVDSIALTLGYAKDIAAFEERQGRELSWL
ncbi:MAG: 3-isopropylmalate dehydratase small subunit, partial [Enhydrobacter sp.]